MSSSVAIAAVIPTRNRADLAIGAARSLLEQDCPIDIFLCDNSSSPERLADYCRGEPRVHYLRPPSEASMPENWDFAIRSAMERSAATHFTVHYDRKISKAGAWGRLRRVAERWPDALLSFPSDFITDQPPPLRVWQPPWTGLPFSIDTRHIAGLLAEGCVSTISHALPVLSNCLVPRAMMQAVVDKFGDVCNSSGPDSAFMWRFLALEDRYIHFDRPLGIFYASHRSTGLGYLRGRGGDFADFVKTFGERPWLDAAPIPGVNLGQNILYHEYELVRRATGDRLPPLDRAAILQDLAAHLHWIADPELKERLREMLRERGWTGKEPDPFPKRTLLSAAWQRYTQLRFRLLKEEPPNICGFTYRNDARALKAALRHDRVRQDEFDHLAKLAAVPLTSEPL